MGETYLRYIGNGAFFDETANVTFEQHGTPQAVPEERAKELLELFPNSFEESSADEPSIRELVEDSQRVDDPDTGDVRYRHPDGGLHFEPTVTGDQIAEAYKRLAELRLEKAENKDTEERDARYFLASALADGDDDNEADSAENK